MRFAQRRLALRLASGKALELLSGGVDLLTLELQLHLELLQLRRGAAVGVTGGTTDA